MKKGLTKGIGDRGGAKIGKKYQVTKERGEGCLNSACLLGSVLLGHLRSVSGQGKVKLNQVWSRSVYSSDGRQVRKGDLLTLVKGLHLPKCPIRSPTLLNKEWKECPESPPTGGQFSFKAAFDVTQVPEGSPGIRAVASTSHLLKPEIGLI